MKAIFRIAVILLSAAAAIAHTPTDQQATATVIVGYVRDSGCVHRFHEIIKPLPNGCVEACVRSGSPLVIVTKKDRIYHPISNEMPDVDVRQRLLPFVGKLVQISGHLYSRSGSDAISLEKIQEVKE